MKITQCTRDHRETFTSATLGSCETFVGNDYHACELGVGDQYTQVYFSADVVVEIKKWVYKNIGSIWHLIDDITFNDFDDLVNQINEAGTDWDEEWELKARS